MARVWLVRACQVCTDRFKHVHEVYHLLLLLTLRGIPSPPCISAWIATWTDVSGSPRLRNRVCIPHSSTGTHRRPRDAPAGRWRDQGTRGPGDNGPLLPLCGGLWEGQLCTQTGVSSEANDVIDTPERLIKLLKVHQCRNTNQEGEECQAQCTCMQHNTNRASQGPGP